MTTALPGINACRGHIVPSSACGPPSFLSNHHVRPTTNGTTNSNKPSKGELRTLAAFCSRFLTCSWSADDNGITCDKRMSRSYRSFFSSRSSFLSIEPSCETYDERYKEFEQTIRGRAANIGCFLFEVLDLLMKRR